MRLFRTVEAKGESDKLLVLKPFIGSTGDPKFFIHFGSIDRVGLNPRSKYNTPNGVYCYPLTQEIFDLLLAGKLPFAQEQPYLHVISYSGDIVNMNMYSNTDFDQDLNKLFISGLFPEDSKEVNSAKMEALIQTPMGRMWNITRLASKGNINKWNAILRTTLGYDGFYDPGLSIIHRSEPIQCVILDTPRIIRIKMMINPYASVNNPDMSSKEDRNHIQKLIDKKTVERHNKIPGGSNTDLLKKYKEMFDSDLPSFYDLTHNIEAIIDNFDEAETRLLIQRYVKSFGNTNNSIKEFILKIIYHDCYKLDAQANTLMDFIEEYKPGDEKLIPIQSLVSAINSLGDDGLENVVNITRLQLGGDAESNKMFNLIKKVLDKKQSKGGIDAIKSNLISNIPLDKQSTLLEFFPSKSLTDEQITFLKKLDAKEDNIYLVANDEKFYNKLGGLSGLPFFNTLSSTKRAENIQDAIFFMKLKEQDPKFEGFNADNFGLFLSKNQWMIDKLKKSNFLFRMCGGPEHYIGSGHRLKFIKMFIDEELNP